MPPGIIFIASAKRIRIHLQRYRFVAASTEESTHIKLSETWNAKPAVLFDVNELVKKQVVCEFNVRHNFIGERDRCHGRLVRQIVEAQVFQHGVEIGVGYALAL